MSPSGAILERFQHELWTRFAIPLVRPDSSGIGRIRRNIPTGREPFWNDKRAVLALARRRVNVLRALVRGRRCYQITPAVMATP
ncbi:hypothetical protein [Streptomyces olivochromogenes]|uniref:Helicase n=1 Tax=Streptomyces olivochromogenes TaxID=1963 RepID=A0A250V5W3_STROL|nr:hypothetical protein [Streptomyces olivochromogenes]KUN49169.1 hypothetical protein AQJ27_01160 [Streptomyces olivochromogenes]GAX49484.1 helicase [Streptomyces olivochromogenes]